MIPILLAQLLTFGTGKLGGASMTPPANVLLIVADDIGWSERAFQPALDDLAAQGTTFTRFYSFPVCSPTRCAILAGMYPRRFGLGDVCSAHNPSAGSRPPAHETLFLSASLLPTHSTCLVGKWHLGRDWDGTADVPMLEITESGPFAHGFQHWLAGNPNSIALGPGATGYFDWYRVDDSLVRTNHSAYATLEQKTALLAWIGAQTGPWFALFAPNAAHAPYDTPPGYSPSLTTRAQYLDVVDYLDGVIADVLATIDLQTTYVVYLGDNGTPDEARVAGSPSLVWKGSTFGSGPAFGGGVCVPLIVAGPGLAQGQTSDRLVSAVDIAPTLLEVLGQPPARGYLDGRSFADELGAFTGTPERTFVFTERYGVPAGSTVQPPGYDDAAIVEASWKLRVVDADGSGPGGKAELVYYLPTDPYELAPRPGWTTADGTPPPPGLTPAEQVALSTATARLRSELNSLPMRKP